MIQRGGSGRGSLSERLCWELVQDQVAGELTQQTWQV